LSFHLLDVNIAFNALSGIVALLVSYYAFHYNRLLESETLKFISLGFTLLGVGLILQASVQSLVVFGIGEIYAVRFLAIGTTAIYDFLQVGAYFVLALGYIRAAFSSTRNEVAGNPLAIALAVFLATSGETRLRQLFELTRQITIISDVLAVMLLSMVVFQGTLTYGRTRNRLALFVLISFGLILASRAVGIGSGIGNSVFWFLIATAIQFAGFLSLLIFIAWGGRIGSARKTTQ
jgi:hypothetical protein